MGGDSAGLRPRSHSLVVRATGNRVGLSLGSSNLSLGAITIIRLVDNLKPQGSNMSGPVLSPDGKYMWTGSEWIPSPPSDGGNAINMQDSVIGGDVISNTTINNDPAAVTAAVISALQQMGMINHTQPQPPPIDIDLPESFKVGDHVEYNSPTNSRWLNRCKVISVNDDGTYKIEVPYSEGVIQTKHAVVIGTSPGTIRPASVPFKQGDKVFVNWKNYGHYYSGRISRENSDGTFFIMFDDGDVEDNVGWERIEPLNEESNEVKNYIQHDSEAENELIEAFKVFDTNNTGTISAREYFKILTEIGDDPIPVEDVMQEFSSMGIEMDSQIDYLELAKYLVASELQSDIEEAKPEVVIRDAEIDDGILRGYAYDHPKLGETNIRSSKIITVNFDERATGRVETKNTIYVVGPTGWSVKPENHPFNQPK